MMRPRMLHRRIWQGSFQRGVPEDLRQGEDLLEV